MEEYIYLELTLKIYKKLIQKHNNIGITLQSYLYRSEDDLKSLLDIAPYIRLVKGAYAEDSSVSMQNRNEIYDNYLKLANLMLGKKILKNGLIPSFATHDHQIIYSLINKINADEIEKGKTLLKSILRLFLFAIFLILRTFFLNLDLSTNFIELNFLNLFFEQNFLFDLQHYQLFFHNLLYFFQSLF